MSRKSYWKPAADVFLRASRHPKAENSGNYRWSSAPFLSGDTFRAIASSALDVDPPERRNRDGSVVIFSTAHVVHNPEFLRRLESVISSTGDRARGLVLHNSDVTVHPEELNWLEALVEKIWSINVSSESEFVSGIPIGLENAFLRRNGVLTDFAKYLQNPISPELRNRMVLSNFHVETNPQIREPVSKLMAKSRHGHEFQFRKRGEYRNEVMHSKFVVSPPGNGLDCHRTWEAIYLGAVPVVLKDSLAKSLTESLPILVVDDFAELCDRGDQELEELFFLKSQASLQLAWAEYWAATIYSERRT